MKPALEVAKRELLDNAATWKMPLTFALATLLLVTGTLSLTAGYRDGAEAYKLIQDEFASRGGENAPEAIAHRVFAHPNPLSLIVGGPAESVRSAFATPPDVSNASVTARHDPLSLRFAPTDLGALGVGVLSLLAILVSYDGVAGEKERGTLKVLLVNPLSRRDILLGKYLGALGSVLLPLMGALVAAVVVLRLAGVAIGSDGYVRLLLVLGFLVLLISAFILVGLLVSALTHRTPVAIISLLFLWLLLVAGAGGLAAFAASVDSEARQIDDVLVEMQAIDTHYDGVEAELRAEIQRLEARNETSGGNLPSEDAQRLRGLRRELADLPRLRSEDTGALLHGYFRSRELDLQRAERFAAASPAESFRSVAQSLARTDYASVREHLDAFSVYLREVEEHRQAHVATGGDEADFRPPAFRNPPASPLGDLARAGPFALVLVAENVVIFLAALVALERYDAR